MSTEIPQYRFNSPTAGTLALVWTLLSTLASLFVIDSFFSESSFVWALAAALVVNGAVGISGIAAFFHHEGPVGPGIFGLAGLKGRRSGLVSEDDGYRSDASSSGFDAPAPRMFNLATGYELNDSGIDTGGIQNGHTGWDSDPSPISSSID